MRRDKLKNPRWGGEQFTIVQPVYRTNVPSTLMAELCLHHKLIAPADLIDGTHAARLLHDAGIIRLEDEVFHGEEAAKAVYEEEMRKLRELPPVGANG